MKLKEELPKKSLNKAYLREKVGRENIENFKIHLLDLVNNINEKESEENAKNILTKFLYDSFYNGKNKINTKGRIDLAIYEDENPVVIIECKKPKDKYDLISKNNSNAKAMHELILYYLRERIEHNNIDIKYLVATDIYEWFIFDELYFDKFIFRNKKLIQDYKNWEQSGKDTKFFYENIARPFISEFKEEIPFTYLNFNDYEKSLREKDKSDDAKLILVYKILSPAHLLKQSFANDSNSLNKEFYSELLHVIGLEEIKDGSKKLIQRKAPEKRDEASLIENTIAILEQEECIRKLENPNHFGTTNDERQYSVALELCITWINRVLFLKLLEAQLINYHRGDASYKFLDIKHVHDYDELNKLFFSILAKKQDERKGNIKEMFLRVPYLNSSLFEISSLEDATIKISGLDSNLLLKTYSSTILKDSKGKRRSEQLNTIQYIFEFLDAYDFTSVGTGEIQEDNKSLINASVLGLIFEKINGYKDGSFFTPGFITMYMCRESIRRAVLQKFNEYYKWKCEKFVELKDKIEDRIKANEIINSLKICDPAVGSGHFLVSALNEIISIKSDLKILCYRDGSRIKDYKVQVENDELILIDENEDEIFEYKMGKNGKPITELQELQEALFHEKEVIIENCMFGVDINPNSVKICRLRLWIELLKHSYYTRGSNFSELETLPNIDINIKKGNSLLSRFSLTENLSEVFRKQRFSLKDYRLAVDAYKNTNSKEAKEGLIKFINEIKDQFRTAFYNNDPLVKQLSNFRGQLALLDNNIDLFGNKIKDPKQVEVEKKRLKMRIAEIEQKIKDIKENKIYQNAFEWRFEFPEVLDEKGNFIGFDLVIGNPPYISNWDLSESNRALVLFLEEEYKPFLTGHWDLFGCFVVLGNKLLKNSGLNSFILPTSFYKEKHSTELRKYFIENIEILQLIDFGEQVVFEDVARQTGIYIIRKNKTENNNFIIKIGIEDKGKSIPQNFFRQLKNFAFKTNVKEEDISIYNKLNNNSVLLGNILCINTGVVAHSKEGSSMTFTKDDVIFKKYKKGYKKYIIGSNISPYCMKFENDYIDYDSKKEHFHRSKFPLLFESEKIIVRRISGKNNRYMACYDDEGYYSNDNLMHLVLWNNEIIKLQKPEKKWEAIMKPGVSLKYILAIINSKVNTYFFSKFLSTDTLQGTYSSIYPEDIRQIPVKMIDEKLQQRIIQKVDKILSLKKNNPGENTTQLENEIDQILFRIYDLTLEEIKIVDGEKGI